MITIVGDVENFVINDEPPRRVEPRLHGRAIVAIEAVRGADERGYKLGVEIDASNAMIVLI